MIIKGARLVLASRSRARHALLLDAGYRVKVCAADLEESVIGVELPFERRLRRLAECKAATVAEIFPHDYVVGADTALVLGGKWIGKAQDALAAQNILERLSGRKHRVGSAICVIAPLPPTGRRRPSRSALDTARVKLRSWDRPRIARHIRRNRPFTCAGCYALQGGAGSPAMIEHIDGDPATVIGMPLALLDGLLSEMGFPFHRNGW